MNINELINNGSIELKKNNINKMYGSMIKAQAPFEPSPVRTRIMMNYTNGGIGAISPTHELESKQDIRKSYENLAKKIGIKLRSKI